jgi:DNA-binding transcriptional ArsR family regulator
MPVDPLTLTFAALANPTRRAILAFLMVGEASVLELAEPFDISLCAVSKHLKVLERAGLVTRYHEAQSRPSRIQGGPLKDALEWLENYRMAWERKLEGLHGYFQELKTKDLEAKKLNAKIPKESKKKELRQS